MLKPKLFTTLKDYSRRQFFSDLLAGIVVGVVALPLAIAFAIASGVSPEKGLYTAIIAGFLISVLGGSKVQIGGPTGAFVVIVYGIVQEYGINGLIISTLLAGIMLIIMGLVRLGSVIKFIPHPVVVGFTSGIALVIFSSQVKDFLGLSMGTVPADFIDKWQAFFIHMDSVNWVALIISAGTAAMIFAWPKNWSRVPPSLLALIGSTAMVYFMDLNVETIYSRFGSVATSLPSLSMPVLDYETIQQLIQPAFTIALLGGIESLLSAVVADGMIGGSHRSNMELVAQGTANIFSALFGGIPATGAIARTATNIRNGGRTPVAGIIHAVTLFLIVLFLGKMASLIPLSCLAGILIVVAYNMSEWKSFVSILKGSRADAAVLCTTFLLTVLIDLTVAIEIGMVLAAFLFMSRMVQVSNVSVITGDLSDGEDKDDPKAIAKFSIPKGVEVFEVTGPFFFGAAYKFKESLKRFQKPPRILIIRMRSVPVIDATGIHVLEEVFHQTQRDGTVFIISGIQPDPFKVLKESGLLDKLGKENVHTVIDDALKRAGEILATS